MSQKITQPPALRKKWFVPKMDRFRIWCLALKHNTNVNHCEECRCWKGKIVLQHPAYWMVKQTGDRFLLVLDT